MKEFYSNKKVYYKVVLIIFALIMMGLFIDNPRLYELDFGYLLHIILSIVLIISLLLYPKYENQAARILIMVVTTAFLYTIFFLYPETSSTFIFLCLIPAFSILFFDSKLFYFSLLLNTVSILFTFFYIMVVHTGHLYNHFEQDLIGNLINFIGSQVIFYLIYHLSDVRIKQQKLYYEQLQHSERLKTTGQLAAAVAHEIRNPLTVVRGFLQLYNEKDTSSNPLNKEHIKLMISELDNAELVISQFLSIAKPDKDKKMELVDVKMILQSVTELLKSYGLLHDNTIDLYVEGDSFIFINAIEFKQLMINIIKNAIEASKLGDSVMIRTTTKNNFVEIKVIDQGKGMSEEELVPLGTPFYSLKSNGTGLGLMICYHIIGKYNGTIHFQSSKGNGTTVTIRFPAKKQ